MKKNNKKKNRLSLLKTPQPKNLELLYMGTQEVTVNELDQVLTEGLSEAEKDNFQFWPQIGIMEITLPSEKVVDVESMNGFMENEEDVAFMNQHGIKTVYAITVEESAIGEFEPLARKWMDAFGGFVCSDSDDFMPMVFEK
ncbi:MAG: hypothetical protein Q4G58_12250 [bacterium]|nr:hypothetical protein [bacterium]